MNSFFPIRQSAIAVAFINVQVPVYLGDLVQVVSHFSREYSGDYIQEIKTPALKLVSAYSLQVSLLFCRSAAFAVYNICVFSVLPHQSRQNGILHSKIGGGAEPLTKPSFCLLTLYILTSSFPLVLVVTGWRSRQARLCAVFVFEPSAFIYFPGGRGAMGQDYSTIRV